MNRWSSGKIKHAIILFLLLSSSALKMPVIEEGQPVVAKATEELGDGNEVVAKAGREEVAAKVIKWSVE